MDRGLFFIKNALGALLRTPPVRALSYGEERCFAGGPTEDELKAQETETFGFAPRFFIALDAKSARADRLSRTLSSLEAQTYRRFSFGDDPHGEAFDYLLYISEGDTLAPDALYHFARAVNAGPAPDMLFADEDVAGADGAHHAPLRKTAFNEITLLSCNSIGRPMAVSRALYARCGGPASASASGEYAYALRCASRSGSIVHIPRMLYARRVHLGPVEPFAGRTAIEKYLKQKRMEGYAVEGLYEGSFRTAAAPRAEPSVAVVIAPSGAAAPLRGLLESIEENTAYGRYRIVLAVMARGEARFQAYLELLKKNGAATAVDCAGLSRAAALNRAARAAKCDVLLFLREDARIVSPHWLDALLEQLIRRGVGAAGGKLVTESGHIACGPYAGTEDDLRDVVKNRLVNTIRGVCALDGGCLMARRKAFFAAGGFWEEAEGARTAALCERLAEKGFACVYTPFCVVRAQEGVNNDF